MGVDISDNSVPVATDIPRLRHLRACEIMRLCVEAEGLLKLGAWHLYLIAKQNERQLEF